MQSFDLGIYTIQITEKSDFDWENKCYPGVQPFYGCKQIHSNLIHERKPNWENTTEGNGIYSNVKGITLKVGVSDCNPIIIMGKERFWIVHAWWKGIQQGIIQAMINTLIGKGESEFDIFIWPSIRKCCYEVVKEFSERCEPQFFSPKANGKFQFDMLGMIKNILKNFPCRERYIHPECTQCGKHFFSYRRGDGINNLVLVTKH